MNYNEMEPLVAIKWKEFLKSGQDIKWLSPTTKKLFNHDYTVDSVLELVFSKRHSDYIKHLLSDAVRLKAHPISRLAKYVLENGSSASEISSGEVKAVEAPLLLPAMILMLTVKLFGESETIRKMSTETRRVIESQQYLIALTTVQLYLSQRFHAAIVNIQLPGNETNAIATVTSKADKLIHQGNKLATLIGDLLCTKVFNNFGKIENSQVSELMCDSLSEYGEILIGSEEFIEKENLEQKENNISVIDDAFSQLIGKGLRSLLIFSGEGKMSQLLAQELGILLGKNMYPLFSEKSSGNPTAAKMMSKKKKILKEKAIEMINRIGENRDVADCLLKIVSNV